MTSADALMSPVPSSPRRTSRIGTPQHFGWLEGLVKALLVLNLLDAIFTLFWINAGLASEANALMRDLVNHHPVIFVTVKLALVALGSYLLWARRESPSAIIAIFAMFFVYYLVLLHHLRYSSLFLSVWIWDCGFRIVC
jgi:Domain of unknown function (DUF5658)